MADEKTYLFDRPRNVRRLLGFLYGCCLLLLALDFIVHRHVEHPWEQLPGFYPAYGFVCCVMLVVVARWMRRLIIRPEDYYRQRDFPQQPGSQGEDP